MRLPRKLGLDQTRGQIFIGFIALMIVVLLVTVGSLYVLLSGVQKRNAAHFADEISLQMSERLQSLLSEINVLTLQLAMDERIQEFLLEEQAGKSATYTQRMQIRKLLQEKTVYSETIDEVELFSLENSIYPIVDLTISRRVGEKMVAQADESLRAGALIWAAYDPANPDYLLAIRQVKLEKLNYAKGGYLVIRIKRSLIDFISRDATRRGESLLYLLDKDQRLISADSSAVPIPDDETRAAQYITSSRPIQDTGWRLEILVPQQAVRDEIGFIRYVMVWAGIVSVVLFALLSYLLSKQITLPIRKLTQVMQQGKDGVLRENPEHYFNREVNQLNTRYNQMVREKNRLIRTVYEIELLKSKSEITALHSQINPHFLFNTLDSIYWMHLRKGEKELAHSIIQLANLFRYTINAPGQDGQVKLEEELDQVRRYVELMKLRWQDRLCFELDIEPQTLSCRLPKLTLQPLVENAIVHGIEPLGSGGMVQLSARVENRRVLVTITDNGVGMDEEQLSKIRKRLQQRSYTQLEQSGRGIGLFNVHHLLQLTHGEDCGITIESKQGEGTVITITLLEKEADKT